MPSSTSALPFAAPAPPPASASGASPSANEAAGAAGKPAFDDMVRRPAKPDDTRRAAHARTGEAQEGSQRRPVAVARAPEDPARVPSDEDAPAPTEAAPFVLLALMEAPAPLTLVPPAGDAAVIQSDPLANPLLGTTTLGTAAPADTLLGGGRATLTTTTPLNLPTPVAASESTTVPANVDVAPSDTPPATTSPIANAPADATAKAPLQNLLSFATHLASGQVAAAMPDAVALGRDIVDAFRSEDGDAPAPTANLLAGVGASNAPLGLSRTETVNPMEAPSADLHGGHFDDDIGDAVRWMADQKIGHAHIKITPNDLGTVEIRLRLEGDRVHADFSSAQADVRQALESSLPRLRDMLGQHGFQLAHADVGQQHAPPSQGGASQQGERPGDAGEPAADAPRTVRMTARGLVDAYA